MTKYLDEYKAKDHPKNPQPSRKVQSDTSKLKFNNIQSCIAVVLVPAARDRMVGVHLTTMDTFNQAGLDGVMGELGAAVGGGACDAYLVAAYGNHDHSDLAPRLRQIARSVWVCDVPAVGGKNLGADVDVKVELHGTEMLTFVRRHAVSIKDAHGGAVQKPGWDASAAIPGQPSYVTDRDSKPWMAVRFRKLL